MLKSDIKRNFKKANGIYVFFAIALFLSSCNFFTPPKYRSDHTPGQETSNLAEGPKYSIGGSVSGLAPGEFLKLKMNDGTPLVVTDNGTFAFAVKLSTGSGYMLEVFQQPATTICAIAPEFGIVLSHNVTNILVTCDAAKLYTVSGTIAGYTASGLVLTLNSLEDTAVLTTGATTFSFATTFAKGSSYSVSVKTSPTGPTQTCTVANGTGTIPDPGASITNVVVDCVTNTYSVGGSVSGLNGTGLTLLLAQTAESMTIVTNGSYTFSQKIIDGGSYTVSVSVHPTGLSQTCAVTNGGGTITGANKINVNISCTTNTYTVGGSISGLPGGNSVTLRLTDLTSVQPVQNLTRSVTGAFNFATAWSDGTPWSVTVVTQPATATCSVSGGAGVLNGSNIGSVGVTCSSVMYTITGAVSGLTGSGLVLQLNGGADKAISANGAFTFSPGVASGSTYNVTVKTHPSTPLQLCTVGFGTGTAVGNVTNVTVTCGTDNPPVAGIAKYYGGVYDADLSSYMATATSSTDDGGIASYQFFSSLATCVWTSTGTTSTVASTFAYSPQIDCTFDTANGEVVINVGIMVRVTDNRGQFTNSSYLYVPVFNTAAVYVKQGGISSTGTDPDSPCGDIQVCVTSASTYARIYVAVQSGTYTTAAATAVTMIPGISVAGNYNTSWTSRVLKANTTILDHTNTGTGSAIAFNMTGATFTNVTVISGITIQQQTYGRRYGFYIDGGAPTIRDNYIIQVQPGGYTQETWAIYCVSCTSLVEKNWIDLERGYGIMVYNTSAHVLNNVVRVDYGNAMYVNGTGTNWMYIVNNSFLNTYNVAGNSLSAAMRIFGASTYTVVMNNIFYGYYGIYESSTTADVRTLYNNDFYGGTGFVAYYDIDGQCTTNNDLDANAYTCNVTDINVGSTLVTAYHTANIAINPLMTGQTASLALSWDMTSTNVDMRYGGRNYSYVTDDWAYTARTSNNPVSGGSTLSGAYGWSIGADED